MRATRVERGSFRLLPHPSRPAPTDCSAQNANAHLLALNSYFVAFPCSKSQTLFVRARSLDCGERACTSGGFGLQNERVHAVRTEPVMLMDEVQLQGRMFEVRRTPWESGWTRSAREGRVAQLVWATLGSSFYPTFGWVGWVPTGPVGHGEEQDRGSPGVRSSLAWGDVLTRAE